MNPASNTPVAFQDVLAAMAEVDRLKSRDELLAMEADLPARVADVTARLKEVYARQGVAVPDQTVALGVEQFFSQRLVFVPPPPNLGLRLAPLWIHRSLLLKLAAGVTTVVLAVSAAVYFLFVLPTREAHERERVAAAEELQQATEKMQSTGQLATVVFADAAGHLNRVREHAPAPEIARAVDVAETRVAADHAAFDGNLQQARADLAPFSPFDQLTFDRAVPASTGARAALTSIQSAGRNLDEVSALSDQLGALQTERASLEAAWRRLDHPEAPAALVATGEQIYSRALAVVTAFGAVAEVRQATAKLHSLADAEAILRSLPEKITTAAAEARAVSLDPRADELLAASERSGLAAAAAGDAMAAERHLAVIHELTARLGESYVLRIVNRPHEYTRLWRFPKGDSKVKNYYVVVEAVDPAGTLVPVRIRNEEDGSTAVVNKWAERVDETTYASVGRDKQDDGVIQNSVFGRKTKGHLAPDYLQGPKERGGDSEAGRINRWEYRG